MVLRSGVIIPFQFRDTKKLLQVGVPEENRNLSIFDLKNVVRAAFGIYNFEFRNKKIGFNIPDELLLHYLAQRHDLTNFVIEIGQVFNPALECYPRDYSNFDKSTHLRLADDERNTPTNHLANHARLSNSHPDDDDDNGERSCSPPSKLRVSNPLSLLAAQNRHSPTPTLTAPNLAAAATVLLHPQLHMEIEPKIEMDNSSSIMEEQHRQHDNDDKLEQEHESELSHFERLQQEFFMQHHQQQQQQQLQQHLSMANESQQYRQRKERMTKKQKDVYVSFLEQNPIINEHRRNDPLLDRYWVQLADILNAVPQGAIKHTAEWKQTFDNWRYRVFLYARFNSKLTGESALNPKNFKPLTHTDKRAYNIWINNPDTAPPDLEKMNNVFVNMEPE